MDRQHRHELKHDKFVDEIGALSSRARENQRLLLYIGGGLVALAVIVYGYFFFRANREAKAQTLLATAIETFDAPVGDAAQQQQQTSSAPKFKTEAERNAVAEKQFKEVQAQYGSSDASDVAGLYLARLAVNRGDVASARKLFEDFIHDHGDHILVDTARFSLYQLRIDNGEAAQVATELNAELAKAQPSLPGDSLLVLLAQAYEMQGNQAKSRESYRRITTEFPDSPYAVDAQRRAGTGAA
jgi:outer membrane protein assembly factor BamD (BamD/ComL family)